MRESPTIFLPILRLSSNFLSRRSGDSTGFGALTIMSSASYVGA
jgi:hypothetical protein